MSSLNKHFTGAACKYLSQVDATSLSNQHEIGSNKLAELLGDPSAEKLKFDANFLYFSDDESIELGSGQVTYYDTRAHQPKRSRELRLYYPSNPVTERMGASDFCLVAMRTNGQLIIAIARARSEHERRLRYLFDLQADEDPEWLLNREPSRADLDLATSSILSALGIDAEDPNDRYLGHIVDKFGLQFPPTAAFSEFARSQCTSEIVPDVDPDASLEAWMRTEEVLFRTLERTVVQDRLRAGFADVDDFVSFSLSVQNRRKSRVGHALENHLEAVFSANRVPFERGAATEANARPDFLFPSAADYQNPALGSPPLQMLAAKTTCKDRWRQVLVEAARIPKKHLFTLETAISESQTSEMQSHSLQLVVPPSVAKTYLRSQRNWLMSLREFIELVR